jgi:hypothetical protein
VSPAQAERLAKLQGRNIDTVLERMSEAISGGVKLVHLAQEGKPEDDFD